MRRNLIILLICLTVLNPLTQGQQIETDNDEYSQILRDNEIRLAEIREKIAQNTNVNPPELQEESILLENQVDNNFSDDGFQQLQNKLVELNGQSTAGKSQKCVGDTMRVPVLDRQVDIGELYDGRTDFLHVGERLWNSNAKKSKATNVQQNMPRSDYSFYMEDNFEDKLSNMNLEASFSCSLSAGMIKVSGQGQFLNNKKKNSKVQRGVLNFDMRTVGEKVQDLAAIDFLWDQFTRKDVTHVVTGIEWGSTANVMVDYEMSDSDDYNLIKGKMQMEMKKAVTQISGKASIQMTEEDKKFSQKFSIKTVADVIVKGSLPTTMAQAVNFMKNIPSSSLKNNGGKGRAQFMTLTPICLVKLNVPKIKLALQASYSEVKANILLQLMGEFRQLDATVQLLNTLDEDFQKAPKMMVGEKGLQKLQEIKIGFERFRNDKKDLIKNILIKFKSGDDASANKLITDLNKYKKNSPFNNLVTLKYISDQNKLLVKRIRIVNELQSKDYEVKVVHGDLQREIGDVLRNKVILFYTVNKVEKPDVNFTFFEQVIKYYKPLNTDFFIVLFDLLKDYDKKSGKTFIEYYQPAGRFKKYSELKSNDYLNYYQHEAQVIINPNEIEEANQFYYIGTLDKSELRSGEGQLFIHGQKSQKGVIEGKFLSVKKYKIYEGGWKSDKFSGTGTIYVAGDEKCKGSFTDGNSSGYLTCTDGKGNYKGELNQLGQRDGKGVQVKDPVNKPNVQCESIWQADSIIKQIKCWNEKGLIKREFSGIYKKIGSKILLQAQDVLQTDGDYEFQYIDEPLLYGNNYDSSNLCRNLPDESQDQINQLDNNVGVVLNKIQDSDILKSDGSNHESFEHDNFNNEDNLVEYDQKSDNSEDGNIQEINQEFIDTNQIQNDQKDSFENAFGSDDPSNSESSEEIVPNSTDGLKTNTNFFKVKQSVKKETDCGRSDVKCKRRHVGLKRNLRNAL